MALIDTLVKVNISVSTAVADAESFDNMLIVGPAPAAGGATTPPDVGVYTEISEVSAAGWAKTDPVYVGASIAFANGVTELYIAVIKIDEDATTALDRAIETPGWYGIAPCGVASDELADIATWADANTKFLGFTVTDGENPLGTSYARAFGFATKSAETYPNNIYTHVAMMATGLSYEAGSETWAYKTLNGIEAEPYTQTEITALKALNLNCYVHCAGKNITLDGRTVSGEWIDVIRFRDWLQNDMQKGIYNLFIMNPKVPFTSKGITLIQNQMIASLKKGQTKGGIAETEYDADGNEIVGFTTSVPTAASVSDADKAARTLKGCKFTARLAGAIHLVEVNGTLVS